MSSITLPERCAPTNLRLREDVRVRMVDSDMYDICSRIKEIDSNLFIIDLEDDDEKHCYAIMETAIDGTEMLVMRVHALDERVLTRLRQLASVSLQERVQQAERDHFRFEQAEKEREFNELYERVGRPMWTQLEHDGFIQRGVSFPKKGAKTKRI